MAESNDIQQLYFPFSFELMLKNFEILIFEVVPILLRAAAERIRTPSTDLAKRPKETNILNNFDLILFYIYMKYKC